MPDHKEKWLAKAEIDYFSPFVSLWLACNSWYNSHYPDAGNRDRDKINKIKTDATTRNHLRNKFKRLILEQNSISFAFRNNVEQLARALDNAGLQEDNGEAINFENASCIPNAARENLKITVHRTSKGNIPSREIDRVIDLGTLTVTSDADKLFSGLFEIIYAIRCKLVHGTLEPNEYNHTVVKYAYLVLWDLMQF